MSEYNMSHTGRELDDAINKVRSGYILPAGTRTITGNGAYDVREYADVNVNVPVPSGYIEIAGTRIYVTKFAEGQYTPSADTTISNISINNIGFKPKIFLLSNAAGIVPVSTSLYYLTSSLMVTDNDYCVQEKSTCFLVYNAGSKVWSGSVSKSGANTFTPTSNGVAGGNNSSIYARSGMPYGWLAWG